MRMLWIFITAILFNSYLPEVKRSVSTDNARLVQNESSLPIPARYRYIY